MDMTDEAPAASVPDPKPVVVTTPRGGHATRPADRGFLCGSVGAAWSYDAPQGRNPAGHGFLNGSVGDAFSGHRRRFRTAADDRFLCGSVGNASSSAAHHAPAGRNGERQVLSGSVGDAADAGDSENRWYRRL